MLIEKGSCMHWHRSIPIAALFVAVSAFAQIASLDGGERAVLATVIEKTRLDGTEKWVMVEDQSRVGFDTQHQEALAYVAGVSWTGRRLVRGEKRPRLRAHV